MRGRKPIPSKIIDIRGGSKLTHRPPREDEPKLPYARPKCPKHLNREARKIWRKTVSTLYDAGIAACTDTTVLARYCTGWAKLGELKEEWSTIKDLSKEVPLTLRSQQYRIEYVRWDVARKEAAKGLVKLDEKKGLYVINPYLKIERESFTQMMITENKIKGELRAVDEQMRRDEIELGMTPSSRSRVKASKREVKEQGGKERFFN